MNTNKELSLVIAGEAGQGIDTVTHIISKVIKAEGFNVFYTKEYMSRIKGGCNSSTIRISEGKVCAHKQKVDLIFAISANAIEHTFDRISNDTIVFYEYDELTLLEKIELKKKIPFSTIAKEVGGSIYENSLILGIVSNLLNTPFENLQDNLNLYFQTKENSAAETEIIEKNLLAVRKGYELGDSIKDEFADKLKTKVEIKKDKKTKDEILINGNDSAALGCIAGSVDFISAYPMSPATGILTFMANSSNQFNIICEQAEDEIAAINMALGASYAGARAMASTSGGGFALMCEAISLSAMSETPIVVYLGQRPGPATGLPTRSEQADLNLVLYSGHGEFPRIILAPGNLQEAFYLCKKAFYFADKFQIPVFVLSDQYLADTCYNTDSFDTENITAEEFITKSDSEYKRYELTKNGISPRSIPNFGDGFVIVDSDEHDEEGHITEDLELRIKMVHKRMSKFDSIRDEIIAPDFFGDINAKNIVIGWGSTKEIIKEALIEINNPNILFISFKQVYPLSKAFLEYFKNAKKIICVENNYGGQFSNLLKQELNINVDKKILKYNGLPFSVEELISKIKEVI